LCDKPHIFYACRNLTNAGGGDVPHLSGDQVPELLRNDITIINIIAIYNSSFIYFLLAENTISLLEYTQSEQETQALPLVEISGICLLFSGHLAPGLPIISFISA
jgi:hypothetical protein